MVLDRVHQAAATVEVSDNGSIINYVVGRQQPATASEASKGTHGW